MFLLLRRCHLILFLQYPQSHIYVCTILYCTFKTIASCTVAGVVCGHYLVIISVIVGVLLLQQLSLSPLLLKGLLDERGHLTLLARTLSANHKPGTTRTVMESPGNTCTESTIL